MSGCIIFEALVIVRKVLGRYTGHQSSSLLNKSIACLDRIGVLSIL